MFKFLRRVFIILILLIIIFFIFRLIKPEATSRFVDKVKAIPATVSSRFHREKDPEIIINGKSNKDKNNEEEIINNIEWNEWNELNGIPQGDNEENGWNINDLTRLEELNNEIESIIQENETWSDWENNAIQETNNNQVSEHTNNETTNLIIEEINTLVWDIEQPENKDNNDTQQPKEQSTQTSTNPSKILTQEQRWNCAKAGLSVKDCEDLVRDFSNYN